MLPTVVSTFAGCGGSSLGYKMAGFKELLAIEWDTNAVETFKLNFPDVPIWQRDINEVTGKQILKFCKIKKGELDVLDGSPPCQGFSTAGKRNVNDSRNDLFKQYTRLLTELQPKVFVMENVSGMMKGKMKGMFLEILAELKSCGYNVKCKLMNAMWYNVPQSRERLIFIGVRNDLGIEPIFPKANEHFITTKVAFEEIKNDDWELKFANKFKGYKVANYWRDLKDGQSHNKRFNLTKIADNKPSPTITKGADGFWGTAWIVHNKEERYLTISECKRLSTFPDYFKFIGKFEEQARRIGNSVPPNMMKAAATTIKTEILGKLLKIKNNGKTTGLWQVVEN